MFAAGQHLHSSLTPAFAILTVYAAATPFVFSIYKVSRMCGKHRASSPLFATLTKTLQIQPKNRPFNPFACHTYKNYLRNLFVCHTYEKQGGTPPSSALLTLTRSLTPGPQPSLPSSGKRAARLQPVQLPSPTKRSATAPAPVHVPSSPTGTLR